MVTHGRVTIKTDGGVSAHVLTYVPGPESVEFIVPVRVDAVFLLPSLAWIRAETVVTSTVTRHVAPDVVPEPVVCHTTVSRCSPINSRFF
jgi:hypothetical protein